MVRDSESGLSYTMWIVILNVAFFLCYLVFSSVVGMGSANFFFALMPSVVLSGQNLWTFLTSMFLHASVGHLFVNMVSLVFIGGFVERLIGRKRFLWFYLISGLFAGVFFVLIAALTGSDLNVFAVGASGAIFGLGGLLAVLIPRLPVAVFFVIPMPLWAAMVVLLFGLWVLSFTLNIPIGNTAHLGGLLVGLVYGSILKAKFPNRTRMVRRMFSR